jgi:hypothetical protein
MFKNFLNLTLIFHEGVKKLNGRAFVAIKTLHFGKKEIKKIVHVYLVSNYQINISVGHLNR